MRVAVTGSSGQIGSYVVDHLAASGHDAIGIDVRPSPRTSALVDLRDAAGLRRALEGAVGVVHCAALVNVPRSFEEPAEDAAVNVIGTLNVLEAARRARALSTVVVSSCAVYGRADTVPIAESDSLLPSSPYAAGKVACEAYADAYRRAHGMSITVARPFNVYSPRQVPGDAYAGVIPLFLARVKGGLPPVVHGEGSQTRDFVHAIDVAGLLARLAIAPPPSPELTTVNIGTGAETSILDVARSAMRHAGLDGEPLRGPARIAEIMRSCADITRARRLGFEPKHTLDAHLKDALRGAA